MAGGVSQYMQAQMLNWVFGGAGVTKPAAWGVGISLGTPNSTSGSECSVSAYARQTFHPAAAGTPTGSGTVSNASTMLFTFSSACTIKGFAIWDTVLNSNSGNLLAWGTLSASSVMVAGDIASFAIGSLLVTLA